MIKIGFFQQIFQKKLKINTREFFFYHLVARWTLYRSYKETLYITILTFRVCFTFLKLSVQKIPKYLNKSAKLWFFHTFKQCISSIAIIIHILCILDDKIGLKKFNLKILFFPPPVKTNIPHMYPWHPTLELALREISTKWNDAQTMKES
jgi:hypothetical protein